MINYLVPNVGSRLECFYPLSVLSNLYQRLQITFDSWNHVLLLCANMSKPVFGVRRSCEAWSFVISGNIPGCSCVLGRWTVCIENFHIGIIFICIKKLEKSRETCRFAASERCVKYDNSSMLFSDYTLSESGVLTGELETTRFIEYYRWVVTGGKCCYISPGTKCPKWRWRFHCCVLLFWRIVYGKLTVELSELSSEVKMLIFYFHTRWRETDSWLSAVICKYTGLITPMLI